MLRWLGPPPCGPLLLPRSEVLDGSSELRIMVCCEKRSEDKVKSSIVAACGIYMRDIIEAVPIDKYFEMFKPGEGGQSAWARPACCAQCAPQAWQPAAL